MASPPEEDEAPRGCGNTFLLALVGLFLLVMCIATVGLAAVAGWRDGGLARQTQRAAAIVSTAHRQATLGWEDLKNARYEVAFDRCNYVQTVQPFYPEMRACMSTAQAALNATPTPTITPSPLPPTPSPGPTGASQGGFSSEELYNLAQDAIRRNEYQDAQKYLESVRALDANFRRREVEDALIMIYTTLGQQYRFEGRISEMVVVIKKALNIRPLSGTDWEYTVYAAELYMSARGYLDALDYARAAQVFARLMRDAPLFSSDTKTLACEAFSKAGDTASYSQYCS